MYVFVCVCVCMYVCVHEDLDRKIDNVNIYIDLKQFVGNILKRARIKLLHSIKWFQVQ